MKIDEDYFKIDDNMKQNTIKDILDEDETILQTLKPNMKVMKLEAIFKGFPFALLWAAFDVFFIIMLITTGAFEEDPALIGFIVPFFALHLLPLWMYLTKVFKSLAGAKNIEYVFTDKRVIIRSGVIGIDFKTIFYTDIEGINVKVGFFDRFFKVGDLYIKAKTQSAVLDDIEKPYFFLRKLQKITLDIKTDILYPNDLRPEENHGYNTKYRG